MPGLWCEETLDERRASGCFSLLRFVFKLYFYIISVKIKNKVAGVEIVAEGKMWPEMVIPGVRMMAPFILT